MNNIIEQFITNMKKEDIIKFANKNNLYVSEHEVDFIYKFIKQNHQSILKNPKSFSLTPYKNEFSNENYQFLSKLIDKYKRFII